MLFGQRFVLPFHRNHPRPRDDIEAKMPPSVDELPDTTAMCDVSHWPTAMIPSLKRRESMDHGSQALEKNSEDRLDIKVGKGANARRWKIHKALICSRSEFFKAAANSTFREGLDGIFDLQEHDPIAFSLFVFWLYDNHQALPPDGTADWKSDADKAWVLSEMLIAPAFQGFALRKVVKHAREIGKDRLIYIYEETLADSPLHLFAAEFEAYRTASCQHRTNNRHLDPETFALEHWSSECGRQGSKDCEHVLPSTTEFPTPSTTEILINNWRKHPIFYNTLFTLDCLLIATISINAILLSRLGSSSALFNVSLFTEIFTSLISLHTMLAWLHPPRSTTFFKVRLGFWVIIVIFFFSVAIDVGTLCPALTRTVNEGGTVGSLDVENKTGMVDRAALQNYLQYHEVCETRLVQVLGGLLGSCLVLSVLVGGTLNFFSE